MLPSMVAHTVGQILDGPILPDRSSKYDIIPNSHKGKGIKIMVTFYKSIIHSIYLY